MSFQFGARSLRELERVHPDLKALCHTVIAHSPVDFGVFDGIRTAAEQNALYRRGASQIDGNRRKGKHQIQSSGYGHAVDLVPWINGQFRWEWGAIYDIATVMIDMADLHDVDLRWGGCWRPVRGATDHPEHLVAAYTKRKREAGQRAFQDGPHWELYGDRYEVRAA